MKYIFDVPCRLLKKKGIFGQLENIDIIAISILGIFGLSMALLILGFIGIITLGLSIFIAWIVFIQPMRYGDNARIWFMRRMRFKKSQKLYYFYRYHNMKDGHK